MQVNIRLSLLIAFSVFTFSSCITNRDLEYIRSNIEINNIKVSTISELRTAVKKYTKIGNTKYIVIKTDTNKEIVINVKDYLDKENNKRNVFKYPKTELYTNIVK